MKVQPVLVEKDYWIMHCLYGLQQLEMAFELKGGTSLSKGYRIINRFSEDIDIRIEPPKAMEVKTGPNHDKVAHRESREAFYDWLAETITIEGIQKIERDTEFDNETYRSGGIRLYYRETTGKTDLKDGVLLEAGFDTVAPNIDKDISSWAYDYAASRVELIDNRALAVPCYEPGYTLVEKLQTISTKYRKQQETGQFPANFLRHYYDVLLLARPTGRASFPRLGRVWCPQAETLSEGRQSGHRQQSRVQPIRSGDVRSLRARLRADVGPILSWPAHPERDRGPHHLLRRSSLTNTVPGGLIFSGSRCKTSE
jgi:hypothetical protein